MILLILLAAVVAGGYYIWNNVVLSNPAALTGTWEVKQGKSSLSSGKFSFVPVEGGAKLVPEGVETMPVDIILKPEGSRTFKARIVNPGDSSQWAEITVELQDINTMKIKASMSDGTKDESEATRTGGLTPS